MAKKFEAIVELGGRVADSLNKAYKTLDKQNKTLEKGYNAIKNVGVKAFKAVAASAAAIATGVIASAEATREFRKDLGKLYNNAELAGMSQQEAWSGLESMYAVSGELDAANEAMSSLMATGYKGKDLTKIIEAINGASVKWNQTVSQSSLAESINETVMTGKSVGQFDEVLSRSGVNIDKFNDGLLNCNGLAERQQYVLKWLANSGLSEVNEAYQKQNKSLVDAYKADLQYQQSMAELGKVAEPIAALFKSKLAAGIGKIADKLKNVDFGKVASAMDRVGELGSQAFDLIWKALSKIDWEKLIDAAVTVLEIFTAIFSFIVDNWSAISPLIYGIVAAMVAYKAILLVTKGIKIASTIANAAYMVGLDLATGGTLKQAAATGIAAAAQGGLNLAFLACPITWIILGIMAVVAVIALIAKKVGGFKELWNICWNAIKKAFNFVVDGIKSGLQAVANFFQPIIDKVQSLIGWFKKAGDALKNSKIGKAVSGAVSWIGDKITGNALGSTITSPTLTWVGEGGDVETIVPHNNKPRSRALALEAVKGTGLNVGGNTFVFSPNITCYGGGASDIRSLLEDERNKFVAQMEEWANNKRRVAF